MRAEAAAAGVARRRLVFGRSTGHKPLHLSRHAALDAALDTAPLCEGCLLYTSPSPRDAHES
eukprot:931752-Prymnesium_polylepis.1